MLLSIVFCVNRDNEYLDRAVQSVLGQTYREFEFLISANNCDDALYEKLERYAREDARIRLFRSNVGQLSYNLNLLADNAVGDFLVRMDADDVCRENRLERIADYLRASDYKIDVLGSWVNIIDREGRIIGQGKGPISAVEIRKYLLCRSPFFHPSVVLRRRWLFEMRGYLGGFVSEDLDLWIRGVLSGARMENIPEFIFDYRVHPGQASRSIRGYAETVAHWAREFLINLNFYTFAGLSVAMLKIALIPLMRVLNYFRLGVR